MRYEKAGVDFLQYYTKVHETSTLYGRYESLS